MPIPSFDELLSEARRIGEAKSQSQDFNRGELIAKSVSEFVKNIFLAQGANRKEYTGSINPSTSALTTFDRPQVRGRSLLERMIGVPGVTETPGTFPVTEEQGAIFGMSKALKATDLAKSSEDMPLPAAAVKQLQDRGFPVDATTTFKQAQIMSGETLTDIQGNIKESGIFRKFKTLPKPGGAGGKPMSADQSDAMLGTITALQRLDEMEGLVNTGKLGTGPTQVKYTNIPGTDRFISAFSSDEARQFKKSLTEYRANYIKTQTGSNRGMKEVAFLLPATIDPNLPQDKLLTDIQNSKNKARLQLKLYEDYARSKGLDLSELKSSYPEYFGDGQTVGGVDLGGGNQNPLQVGGQFNGSKILKVEKIQ